MEFRYVIHRLQLNHYLKWVLFYRMERHRFPIRLLPKLVNFDTIVGKSTGKCFNIPNGIDILPAYGDMQAMMHLAFRDHQANCIVLNMGTSIQLARMKTIGFIPERKSMSSNVSVDYCPLTNEHYIEVAAGLNGGNVLREYIGFLQKIIKTFTDLELDEQSIWNKLNEIEKHETIESNVDFRIEPTLFGERHDMNTFFSIENIRFGSPSLQMLTRQLCASLIENIFKMMHFELDISQTFTHLMCTGNVFRNNSILRHSLNHVIQDKFPNQSIIIDYIDQCDAEVGCALFAHDQISKN